MTFHDILKEHPFFRGLEEEHIELLVGCCQNVVFRAGEYIGHEGKSADHFFVVREGKVAIQVRSPTGAAITLQTVGRGEIIGWSWLFPPYRWSFDIVAIETTRTIALDGACLRGKCEEQPLFGYQMMKRFSQILVDRLTATRMQLLDVYKYERE